MMGKFTPSAQTILSILVTVMFGFVLIILLLRPITVNEQTKEILLILLGVLGAQFGVIVNYHFGSSAGSRIKDDTIRQMTTTAAEVESYVVK